MVGAFCSPGPAMDIGTLDSLRIVLDPVGQTGVAMALMLVMFSVALGLKVDDFSFLLGYVLHTVLIKRCKPVQEQVKF